MKEYTRLEYIESDKNQYIDTGFKPNGNTRVEMDAQMNEYSGGGTSFFGVFGANNVNSYSFLDPSSAADYYAYYYGSNNTVNNPITSERFDRGIIVTDKGTATYHGIERTLNNASFTSTLSLYLFGGNHNGAFLNASSMKLYSCRIYDNGTLVRDYIPVKNSEGICGLYDQVEKIFYSSQGSKDFIGGAEVEDKPLSFPYGFRRRLMNEAYSAKITMIRINQNLADPATMITRIVDEGGIEAIRANSHRYVGVFDSTANLMSLRQLNDNDGTKYLDGTTAPITTLGNDVWMKLPQFYWKCEEYATDVWDFSVAYGAKPDDTFKEWDGKDLIGAYEAYVSSSKLYSVSGVTSTGSVSQSSFKTYSRNRGDGFTLVKWKHHCMMAMLFYAYYCNTDSQGQVGHGLNVHTKITGGTNPLCMLDTIGGVNGDTASITFWGLENWWGNKYEYIDNVTTDNGQTNSSWSIVEDDGSLRNVECPFMQGTLRKAKFGIFIDIVTSESTTATATTGYCDYFYIERNKTNRVLRRSFSGEGSNGGVSYIDSFVDSSNANEFVGTRLAYRGDYIITD